MSVIVHVCINVCTLTCYEYIINIIIIIVVVMLLLHVIKLINKHLIDHCYYYYQCTCKNTCVHCLINTSLTIVFNVIVVSLGRFYI